MFRVSSCCALAALVVIACGDDTPASTTSSTARDASMDAAEPPSREDSSSAKKSESDEAADEKSPAKFFTEPVAEGYQRFEPPALEVGPGESYDWAQWVGGPLDQDYDVVDINGTQSIGGHHALVYASTVAERPGKTRLWRDEDQLTARLMGGIGGEGGANVQLPKGVVFRVQKGSYILIQTHYLNVTDKPILGRTVMDIKMEPVDTSRTVASMMSVTSLGVRLPAHAESKLEVSCKTEKDLKFLMLSNHMHDWGTVQTTTFVDPDGEAHTLVDDQHWSGTLALNPTWTRFTLEEPNVIPKGSVITTQCTWDNTTDNEIKFPAEMCVFFGFVLNENDIYCNEGMWSEASSFGNAAASSTPEHADEVMMTAPPATDTTPDEDAGVPAAFGCQSMADQTAMHSAEFDAKSTQCATSCGVNPNMALCAATCLEKNVGLSAECAACNGTNIACGSKNCLSQCLAGSASTECRSCVKDNCDAAFHMCTGI